MKFLIHLKDILYYFIQEQKNFLKKNNKKNEQIEDIVSFGKIRDKAKILNSINEKPFNPCEKLG